MKLHKNTIKAIQKRKYGIEHAVIGDYEYRLKAGYFNVMVERFNWHLRYPDFEIIGYFDDDGNFCVYD